MSNNHLPVAREILKDILNASPLKGARLKPLLIREFESRTGTLFSRAFWQYPKFLLFLKANEDLVDVTLPVGPGDILVQLHTAEQPHPHQGQNAPIAPSSIERVVPRAAPASLTYLDAALWHAFTNPDPARKRFYNPATQEVLHYLDGSTNSSDQVFEAKVKADRNLIEIKPISADKQKEWMKSFLENHEIPDAKRPLLENLASLSYTSQTNKAFSAALEVYADAWRRYRTSKILDYVHNWARLHLPPDQRIVGLTQDPAVASKGDPERQMVASGANAAEGDLRALLHTAVDALSDNELSQILIPAIALRKVLTSTRK